MSCLAPSSCDAEKGVSMHTHFLILKMIQLTVPCLVPSSCDAEDGVCLNSQLPIHVIKRAPEETINRKNGGYNTSQRKR